MLLLLLLVFFCLFLVAGFISCSYGGIFDDEVDKDE